ncbi:DUF1793-domain-containing protein [Marasmius fiardii PR-910]|nr:DUF1793-domain-containing protein [Marasmius fiardii PR-910]
MSTVQTLIVIFFSFLHFHSVYSLSWSATPFNPPSIPLAVRTPYLSTWLNQQKEGTALNGAWPTFWNGRTLGWAGFVRVDGKAYSYLGDPQTNGSPFEKATQKSFEFTSTQSTFVLSAGPVDLTVKFLSPVEPSDLARQSLPFSYLSITATSTDGTSHTVQVYSDTSAEWVSGDSALAANWTTTTDGILAHRIQLQNPQNYQEVNEQIQHGSFYYSTLSGSGVSYQTGADRILRTQFVANGTLYNNQDSKFRAVQDNFPVFAFAHDIGPVSSESPPPVVIALGHVRDPVIQYITANGVLQDRAPYFLKQFTKPLDAIESFIKDYDAALSRAKMLDSKVQSDASKISNDYAGIVTLSVRQFFGSIEFTLSRKPDGTLNDQDILVFMKEISSNGNMNTVDVIFPAWPAILYFNPTIGKYLLDSLFQYQATGQYPNEYALHDLGAHYPQAVGHNDGKDEPMPVEESGNMLIMALSYAQKTGDNSQLQQYLPLLDQWTQFLINDSLIPEHQISTDDFAGPLVNQTNLATKGIIGIEAMSKITGMLGDSAKSQKYDGTARSYVTQWEQLAMSPDGRHLTLNYGNASSWGLAYNLYADRLLGLNLFPQSVYTMQTEWYKSVARSFGVPLDTRHSYTKSDWEIWTAGIMADNTTRDMFIKAVTAYLSSGMSSQPFGDWYDTTDGKSLGFRARPVVGGHLALLAL